MLAMNTGATAQPMFPESPCTENAWPRRGWATRRFSKVKSAGWKMLFPHPATAAASISIGYVVATPSTMPDSASMPMPANSTGRAPMRSTTNPATACPTPLTTKKTVISMPASV